MRTILGFIYSTHVSDTSIFSVKHVVHVARLRRRARSSGARSWWGQKVGHVGKILLIYQAANPTILQAHSEMHFTLGACVGETG